MCRMFGVDGSAAFALSLQKSLIMAAAKDEFSRNNVSHDDGWGGVWSTREDRSYYRSSKPIFKDERANEFFPVDGKATIAEVVHARKAAPNEPIRGPFDSHPFIAQLGEETAFVVHNGHIDKTKFSDLLGVDASQFNDTEVFAMLLQRQTGGVKVRIEAALDQVYGHRADIGALNLIMLVLGRGADSQLFYYSDYPDPGRKLYYSLYTVERDQSFGVMSSTVAYEAGFVDREGTPQGEGVKRCAEKELYLFRRQS